MKQIANDPFYRICDSEIIIEGLQKEYVFMHISDLHMNVCDELADEIETEEGKQSEKTWLELREYFANSFGEPFEEVHKIPSEEAVDKMLALAEELKPEVLLLSGDILNFTNGGSVRSLRKKLAAYSGKHMFVPGNHDSAKWTRLVSDGAQVIDFGEFMIVGIDNSERTINDIQLAELKALCALGKPIIMLQHIPIMTEVNREYLTGFGEYFSIDINGEDANGAELAKIEAEEPRIKAILCGHIHGHRELGISEGKRQISASSGLVGFVHRVTVRGAR